MKIDITFVIALIIVISGGIYINVLNRRCKSYLVNIERIEKVKNSQYQLIEQYSMNYLDMMRKGQIKISSLPTNKLFLYCPFVSRDTNNIEYLGMLSGIMRDLPRGGLCLITDEQSLFEIDHFFPRLLAQVKMIDEKSELTQNLGCSWALFFLGNDCIIKGYLQINDFNRSFIPKYLKLVNGLINY